LIPVLWWPTSPLAINGTAWAVEALKVSPGPLHTCEAVLTEACFLLERNGINPAGIFAKLKSGGMVISCSLSDEAVAVETLMHRYASRPMSLADACLVRMSELHRECRLPTLDRDFDVYRRHGRDPVPLLSPWR
jgi:uncharacterized protein